MKIPDVAYDPIFGESDYISVLPHKNSDHEKIVKLPKWLVQEIEKRVEEAIENGQNQVREAIKEVLHIDSK